MPYEVLRFRAHFMYCFRSNELPSNVIDFVETCARVCFRQQFDVDEKELLDSFIGLWQQPTALFPEACQRHEEEEYIPKEKLFEVPRATSLFL